tara:strand:- start:597 stop:1286 length:690 start_codon:yes stop_codon:yes gene_type:complete
MERQFKGIWIPAHIWLSKDLTAIDKFLLADIDSFTGNGKKFYKSNDTISKDLFVSVKSVSRSVKHLAELGLIEVSGNTRKRILVSNINSGQDVKDSRQSDSNTGHKVQPVGTQSPTTNTVTNTVTNQSIIPVEGKILSLPFNEDEFIQAWAIWLKERKDRRSKKYSFLGEQKALNKLARISNNDVNSAIAIIDQSIENNWLGFFPIKNDKRNSKTFDTNKYSDYLQSLS